MYVIDRFLRTDIGEIRVFSRDEKKQDDMRHEFQVKMPEVSDKIKFLIGDVRDIEDVYSASAWQEEGRFSGDDISLAIQRQVLVTLGTL